MAYSVTKNLMILTPLLKCRDVFSEFFTALGDTQIGASPIDVTLDGFGLDMHGLSRVMNRIPQTVEIAYA